MKIFFACELWRYVDFFFACGLFRYDYLLRYPMMRKHPLLAIVFFPACGKIQP